MTEYATPSQLRRLLAAIVSVGSDLALAAVLERITVAARELVRARYAALGVIDETRTHLTEFITVGLDDDQRAAIGELPKGHGILGLLITDPGSLRLADLREHPASFGFPPNHPPMRTFLGVPLYVGGEVFGNLYLTDKEGGEGFSDIDEELATGLAAAAAVAIERARLYELTGELRLLADRERIARDLHDSVVQRLFAIGLSLQGTARLASRPEVVARLEQHVEDLDATIRQIRSTVFQLEAHRLGERSLRVEVLDVVGQAGRALGFEPALTLEGALDNAVPDEVAADAVACLREMLSNVTRHAGASRVEVTVAVADGRLLIDVRDDGRGLPADSPVAGNGLRNLVERAGRRGGSFRIRPTEPSGARAELELPLA